MTTWAEGQIKLRPGHKAYLFVGPAGNAIDYLIRGATTETDHTIALRPPLEAERLSSVLGSGLDTQTTLVRDVHLMDETDWELIGKYLKVSKVKGSSLILVGEEVPDLDVAQEVKGKIGRQGLYVDVSSPKGEVGRKALVNWLAYEWQVHTSVAEQACLRADYSVERLVWATNVYKRLSSGRVLTGRKAVQLMEVSVPVPRVNDAYRLTLSKNLKALDAVQGFNATQNLQLFRMLESALTDLSLIHAVLQVRGTSMTTLSSKSGVHIVRVMELAQLATLYSPRMVQQCRQALKIGFDNYLQPEAASMVVAIWG